MAAAPTPSYPDAAFNAHLTWVVETTKQVLDANPQASYAPMLFIMEGGQPHLSLLAGLPESEEERREAMRLFGNQWRDMGRPAPEAVFFAAEVWMARYSSEDLKRQPPPKPSANPKAWEAIFIMGRAGDGRHNNAEVQIKRRADKTIQPGETITNVYEPATTAPGKESGLLGAFYEGLQESKPSA